MKTILALCLCLFAFAATAQESDGVYATTNGRAKSVLGQEASAPMRGANIIVIYSPDSIPAVYSKLGKLLLSEGYPIEKSDKELGYINSGFRTTPSNKAIEAALRFTISGTTKGTKIEVRGACVMPAIRYGLGAQSAIECRGMRGSMLMTSWDEMNRMARLYGGQLAYVKKN
jgi:hypothetical protein